MVADLVILQTTAHHGNRRVSSAKIQQLVHVAVCPIEVNDHRGIFGGVVTSEPTSHHRERTGIDAFKKLLAGYIGHIE
jgi:hypothetical protein